MKCTEARALLASDYIDGELDGDARGEVVRHLEACVGCRQYEETVRRAAVEPFRNAPRDTAPASLWPKVRRGIQREREGGVRAALCRLRRSFFVPAAAYAAAFAAAAVIAVMFLARAPFTGPGGTRAPSSDSEELHAYIQEQFSILAYQDANGAENFANGNGAGSANFGTVVEEYLM